MTNEDFEALREAGVFERAALASEGFRRDGETWVQVRPWWTVETDYRDGNCRDWVEVCYFADYTSARKKWAERYGHRSLPEGAVQVFGVDLYEKKPGHSKVRDESRAMLTPLATPDFDGLRERLKALKGVTRRL